jgi:hypothetical protein
VIAGLPADRPKFGVGLGAAVFKTRHVVFGPDWKPDPRPALGEAEKPFDCLQVLQLKADAIREAAGVDIGIVWSHTPGWNRWATTIPAGPVSLHQLATLDMLPEYVYVGEMKGASLLRQRGEPAAWSLLGDPREPGFVAGKTLTVADIQTGKTYRVAYGCFGAPAYGVNPPQMPKLFKWSTQEEFLAGPTTSMPVTNLVQTPLQVVEAVARYVRKRGKIAPRSTSFSLTDYIANPRDNNYAAYDWLHLGAEVSWKHAGGTQNDRYTLNLGVRPDGETKPTSPRPHSKEFAEIPLGPTNFPAFDLGALDMKLPVAVTGSVARFSVAMDAAGKSYTLGPEGATGAVGQAILVNLVLVNKGQADLAVSAVLSDTAMRNENGQSWPEGGKEARWYYGYHRSLGRYTQPPNHEDGALILVPDAGPRKLVAPNAGCNFGLVGLEQSLAVKTGQSLTLPVFLISLNRPGKGPEISLQAALESMKATIAPAAGAARTAGGG